jgi:hypothetical protein
MGATINHATTVRIIASLSWVGCAYTWSVSQASFGEHDVMGTRTAWIHPLAIVMGFGLLSLTHWQAVRGPQPARMQSAEAGVKRRYEILLPTKDNAGQPIAADKFTQTREDLVNRFGGITIIPQPVQGVWVDQGKRYEDESIRLVIDVDDDQANRAFFQEFKKMLNERFRQQDVYVTSWQLLVGS